MATLRFAAPLLFTTCLLLAAAGARASSEDDGSEPPCPPGLDWRTAAEEIRTLAARGEWGQLDGVYARFQSYSCAEDLWRAVDCELEAGKLWGGQHEHITASLDSPKRYRPARRAACGRILGTAFAAVYDRASQDPDALRHARYAAIWLEVAPRTPEVQSAMASLPEEARAYARTARSLTRRPLFDAAGENPSLATLAQALNDQVALRGRLAFPACEPDVGLYVGLDQRVTDIELLRCGRRDDWGGFVDARMVFVERTARGTYRARAWMRAPIDTQCTGGWDEVLSFTHLNRAEHGIDGYLYVWRFGDWDGVRPSATFATVCNFATEQCRHAEIGNELCVFDEDPRTHEFYPEICLERWEGVPTIARGYLSLTPSAKMRDGKPSGLLPRAWRRPVRVDGRFGSLASPNPSTIARAQRLCTRFITAETLEVRERPDANAAVVTTLAAVRVFPKERRGKYRRIVAPVAGWVEEAALSKGDPNCR